MSRLPTYLDDAEYDVWSAHSRRLHAIESALDHRWTLGDFGVRDHLALLSFDADLARHGLELAAEILRGTLSAQRIRDVEERALREHCRELASWRRAHHTTVAS